MPGKILVDMAPLRESRQFRLLFFGQLVTTVGSQLTVVAIPYQVYGQTHSSLQVGAISLAQLVPLVVGSLVGGTVGDAVDRRKLLLGSSALLALTSSALAVNALVPHPSLLALYLISALAAGLTGFVNPARNAVDPRLVRPSQLIAAPGLHPGHLPAGDGGRSGPLGTADRPSRPAVGVRHRRHHLRRSSMVAVFVMAPLPPAAGARRPGVGSIMEGLRYLRGRQVIQGAYLIDINAMVFGMPRALFPALAQHVFGGGAATLGYLYAAPGVGALLGAVTTGWVTRIRRQGRAVVVAVVVWGVAITVFGFVDSLPFALVLLAVAGWADVISAVLRNTIIQTNAPDEFRSRLSSIQMAVVQGGRASATSSRAWWPPP